MLQRVRGVEKLSAIPVTELDLDELRFLVETGDPLDGKCIGWCRHLDKEQIKRDKHQWRQERKDEFDEYHLDSDDETENAMEIDMSPYAQMMLARIKADGDTSPVVVKRCEHSSKNERRPHSDKVFKL